VAFPMKRGLKCCIGNCIMRVTQASERPPRRRGDAKNQDRQSAVGSRAVRIEKAQSCPLISHASHGTDFANLPRFCAERTFANISGRVASQGLESRCTVEGLHNEPRRRGD
jgi:hypothetical protein